MEKNDLTSIGDDDPPPTLNELEDRINQIVHRLGVWEGIIANQLPSRRDKQEFLAVMSNFMDRLERIHKSYYELVEAVDFQLEMIKSHPKSYTLDPEFAETAKIMKSLADVKKKWWKHKKPW
jgi:hypothetical protein